MMHIPPISYHQAAEQKPYQNAHLLTKKLSRIFWEKSQENGPVCTKTKSNRKSKGSRQKNKRGDSRVESNDSPEIPDGGGETSDMPGLPSREGVKERRVRTVRGRGGWRLKNTMRCIINRQYGSVNPGSGDTPSNDTNLQCSVKSSQLSM